MDGEDMAALLIILGGVILVTGIVYSVYAYTQVLPVCGWYERAYSAADAEQMAVWLDNLLNEMEARGMTHGHYALVFKNPHNDAALDYEVFKSLKQRCLEVQKYPKGSMDYAESLEDIRRQMDKTDFNPWWWYMCNTAGGVFGWMIAFLWWIIWIIALFFYALYE